MRSESASWGLLWDGDLAGQVVVSQRWVLSAMKDHGPALVTMLWRILGNEHDVCDAYQDTFVQLVNCRRRPDNVAAFVFRSASNTAVQMLRRRKMHRKACRVLAADASICVKDSLGDLDSQQLQTALRDQIARLPESLRGVVLLKDLAELPYAQVARILGISVPTARVYRCRAIQMLAAWMAQPEETQP